jgi:hypothetical protein
MPDGTKICSCGEPRGTRNDGSPRKDRYCAKCRRDYEKNRRAASKQEFQKLVARTATLERVLQERSSDVDVFRSTSECPGHCAG